MPQSQGPPGTEQTHGKGFGVQGQTQLIVGGSAGSCPHSLLLSGPRRGFPGGTVVKNPPVGAGDTEAQVRSLGRDDPLEKTMATHSSILAWRITWTVEPGGLQSMGSQRVGHDCATKHTGRTDALGKAVIGQSRAGSSIMRI